MIRLTNKNIKMEKHLAELKDKYFYRAVFTELFGTAVFVYLVTSVLINLNPTSTGAASIVQIAFAIGLAISVLAQTFGPISGAHFNPAVTIGLLVKGDVSIIKTIFYVVAQHIGGVVGAAITYSVTPASRRGNLGSVAISSEINEAQGFFVEFLLTSLLMFTVLASTSKDHGRKDFGYANGLAIGISITVAHLVGIPYTGACINPARAVGPALVINFWPTHYWLYWIGPILGAIFASVLYRFIFSIEDQTTYKINEKETRNNNTSHQNEVVVEMT